jgi:hypothetical protein
MINRNRKLITVVVAIPIAFYSFLEYGGVRSLVIGSGSSNEPPV